jgi:hypothetical protein
MRSMPSIEGTMMKSGLPDNRIRCRYCGLESVVTSHGTMGECIAALEREVNRLRQELPDHVTTAAAAARQQRHSQPSRGLYSRKR